jgi:hypothetical protein
MFPLKRQEELSYGDNSPAKCMYQVLYTLVLAVDETISFIWMNLKDRDLFFYRVFVRSLLAGIHVAFSFIHNLDRLSNGFSCTICTVGSHFPKSLVLLSYKK